MATHIPTLRPEDIKAKKKISKPLQLVILICGGVILILISIIGKHILHWYLIICELLSSIGEALIIGPALSWILDLPSMIKYFKTITVESLISREYLNSLPRNQLLELRKECTAKIHLKDTDIVEKGLINLDENVCELLTQPYFERFRQNTTCHKEGKLFVKKHYIEEYIVNPLNTKTSYNDFPKTYLFLNGGADIKDVFEVINLSVKIDDNNEQNLTNEIDIKHNPIDMPDIHFDTEIVWQNKQGISLSFDFSKHILIKRTIIVKTPIEDIMFIKRVKMPVKSFIIDYSYKGDDLKLIGTCFGTLSYSNDGGMKIIQEDGNISIESFNWLLPGNGIVIIKVPK
jgi:hypothetical protein